MLQIEKGRREDRPDDYLWREPAKQAQSSFRGERALLALVVRLGGGHEAFKAALDAAVLTSEIAEVTMRAENTVALAGEDAARMQKLLDALEALAAALLEPDAAAGAALAAEAAAAVAASARFLQLPEAERRRALDALEEGGK